MPLSRHEVPTSGLSASLRAIGFFHLQVLPRGRQIANEAIEAEPSASSGRAKFAKLAYPRLINPDWASQQ